MSISNVFQKTELWNGYKSIKKPQSYVDPVFILETAKIKIWDYGLALYTLKSLKISIFIYLQDF